MKPQDYFKIVKKSIDLQKRLISKFESTVEISSSLPEFLNLPDKVFDKISNHKISQLFRLYPNETQSLSLSIFVTPRKGVLELDNRNWLFQIHGSTEVSFLQLSKSIKPAMLEQVKQGKVDILLGTSHDLAVEVQYLKDGRVDGADSWSMFLFTSSMKIQRNHMSQDEHQLLLEQLVKQDILTIWESVTGNQEFFVIK